MVDSYQSNASSDSREGGIQLTVGGRINSVTIMPQFRIFSSTQGQLFDRLPFEIKTTSSSPNYVLLPTNASPFTIDLSLSDSPDLRLDIASDFGEAMCFYDYRMQHPSEDLTFQFGITILSVDYTPVPEPGTVGFLGIGILAFLCVRRSRNLR